ncbi:MULTISPECIES: arginase family protein [Gordonia]|uniref:arginase family protein n=1 Tax=Gordonia TaxID=2053 RepID=UPI00339099FB
MHGVATPDADGRTRRRSRGSDPGRQEDSVKITVLGAPSSAGAYCVGVERAPTALRDAGLIEQLAATGAEVVDAGDLTTRLWFPDRESPFAQNLGDETDALEELSAAAAGLLAAGQRLLVLGGSCTAAPVGPGLPRSGCDSGDHSVGTRSGCRAGTPDRRSANALRRPRRCGPHRPQHSRPRSVRGAPRRRRARLPGRADRRERERTQQWPDHRDPRTGPGHAAARP